MCGRAPVDLPAHISLRAFCLGPTLPRLRTEHASRRRRQDGWDVAEGGDWHLLLSPPDRSTNISPSIRRSDILLTLPQGHRLCPALAQSECRHPVLTGDGMTMSVFPKWFGQLQWSRPWPIAELAAQRHLIPAAAGCYVFTDDDVGLPGVHEPRSRPIYCPRNYPCTWWNHFGGIGRKFGVTIQPE